MNEIKSPYQFRPETNVSSEFSGWSKNSRIALFVSRFVVGWMMFYAGITKILDSQWSAADYMSKAKTFSGLYAWLSQPGLLPIINFINEWGLTLLGVALMLGVFVRLSSVLGAVLMMLYYLPILDFPYPNTHSFIVDEHIIYISILLLFAAVRAGRFWGLDNWCSRLPICSKFPSLRKWLG